MSHERSIFSEEHVSLSDLEMRATRKEILATTALYGPWTPKGEFDWKSYENLVQAVIRSGSVPATNVDTTWAIYNAWPLTKEMIWRTAEIASENAGYLGADRPLVVAGLNTNSENISTDEIVPALRKQIHEIEQGLKLRGFEGIRYMPVPDKRLFNAPANEKVKVYKEMGKMIGDFTDFGMVFFELDIGIDGFGSNFTAEEIAAILEATPQIQEYKSAIISKKPEKNYAYDYAADVVRIKVVETVAPDRVQFSTGNDWFISLAKYGKNIEKHGYLLGASQMSPALFQRWREGIQQGKTEALAIEHDLQAAAKDFWTPGNVGIYRHYMAIFLAMTGLIEHPLPHPDCNARYRVLPENYLLPLKHALRMGLIDESAKKDIARKIIPGFSELSESELERLLTYLG